MPLVLQMGFRWVRCRVLVWGILGGGFVSGVFLERYAVSGVFRVFLKRYMLLGTHGIWGTWVDVQLERSGYDDV